MPPPTTYSPACIRVLPNSIGIEADHIIALLSESVASQDADSHTCPPEYSLSRCQNHEKATAYSSTPQPCFLFLLITLLASLNIFGILVIFDFLGFLNSFDIIGSFGIVLRNLDHRVNNPIVPVIYSFMGQLIAIIL